MVLSDALRTGGAAPTYTGLMHGADWLPTLATAVGFSTDGTLPLDGVSQWAGILGGTPSRTKIVIGNSTNECSWDAQDPRYHLSASLARDGSDLPAGFWNANKLGCGFAIKEYTTDGHHWKLIKGYGGGPDTWCNSTSSQPECGPAPETTSCPNGWCLYDTAADPHERAEVSGANAAVVDKMTTELKEILLSYHQYEADPACMNQTFGSDSHVGKTWEPWC
jgi:hypothetical protein